MLEMSESKMRILQAALDLFSKNGVEATSVGMIADQVGIRKASLYSHFDSKQDIFDTLFTYVTERYEENSYFTNFRELAVSTDVERIITQVKGQLAFSLHDPVISKTRRMLTIEQFRMEDVSREQERRTYGDIVRCYAAYVRTWMDSGLLRRGDAELLAEEFVSPISMQLFRVDRDPALEEEAIRLIEKHIRHFFTVYGK